MRKRNHEGAARPRVLVLVDESNVSSSVRTVGRGLDWLKLRDFLAGPNTGRDLTEMVVYAGLPPARLVSGALDLRPIIPALSREMLRGEGLRAGA